MGIMTRMFRLCKADAHGVMDQLEDKGLLLKQYLREMQASLGNREQQVSELTRRISRLAGQIVRYVEEMDKLERDLTLALGKGKDDIARMLIRRRRALATASSSLKDQVETLTQEKTQLSETLAHQRLQYETLSAKAGSYCRHSTDRLFEMAYRHGAGMVASEDPSDEEIELELLERKEVLRKGGTP